MGEKNGQKQQELKGSPITFTDVVEVIGSVGLYAAGFNTLNHNHNAVDIIQGVGFAVAGGLLALDVIERGNWRKQ